LISVDVVLYVVLVRGHFSGLLSTPGVFGGVGPTCDIYSFGSVSGEMSDWFYCVYDLDLPDRMPLGTPWGLCRFRFLTWVVG